MLTVTWSDKDMFARPIRRQCLDEYLPNWDPTPTLTSAVDAERRGSKASRAISGLIEEELFLRLLGALKAGLLMPVVPPNEQP